jgi:hypothetical protein
MSPHLLFAALILAVGMRMIDGTVVCWPAEKNTLLACSDCETPFPVDNTVMRSSLVYGNAVQYSAAENKTTEDNTILCRMQCLIDPVCVGYDIIATTPFVCMLYMGQGSLSVANVYAKSRATNVSFIVTCSPMAEFRIFPVIKLIGAELISFTRLDAVGDAGISGTNISVTVAVISLQASYGPVIGELTFLQNQAKLVTSEWYSLTYMIIPFSLLLVWTIVFSQLQRK